MIIFHKHSWPPLFLLQIPFINKKRTFFTPDLTLSPNQLLIFLILSMFVLIPWESGGKYIQYRISVEKLYSNIEALNLCVSFYRNYFCHLGRKRWNFGQNSFLTPKYFSNVLWEYFKHSASDFYFYELLCHFYNLNFNFIRF